jgi:hypothetical protein
MFLINLYSIHQIDIATSSYWNLMMWWSIRERVINKVNVELNWIRARMFYSRFEQNWTYSSRSSESNELRFLFERITRARIFVLRVESNMRFCLTSWIEQTYLFVEHSTRVLIHTKISSWAFKSWIEQSFLFDELNWTSNSVRRIDLNDQVCSS